MWEQHFLSSGEYMERYPGISVSARCDLFCDGDRNGSAVLDGSDGMGFDVRGSAFKVSAAGTADCCGIPGPNQ